MHAATRARIVAAIATASFAANLSLPALALPAAEGGPEYIPTNQLITPTAAPGSRFLRLKTDLRPDGNADGAEAVTTALSPDGKTLLVLTSGYNTSFNNTAGQSLSYSVLDPTTGQPSATTTTNAEWVFVYDVSKHLPKKLQQINIPNTYDGLAWKPDGSGFYVSAGIDDRIYVYKLGQRRGSAAYIPDAPFIMLGHNSNQTAPLPAYDGGLLKGTPAGKAYPAIVFGAVAAGIATSADGSTLAVANQQNDSLSIVNTGTRQVTNEVHFFVPGQSAAVGEYPYWVAVKSAPSRMPVQRHTMNQMRRMPNSPMPLRNVQQPHVRSGAASNIYVSILRDDEVIDVSSGSNTKIIPVGDGPNRMLLSHDQSTLYVANGNSDSISVIDTASDTVTSTISLQRPGDVYMGSNPNALALSPDAKTLYVTLGGENAVAVVDLTKGVVKGRIPTGWYPNSVTVSADGRVLYVVNAKSNSGPDPANGYTTNFGQHSDKNGKNEYDWANEKAGLLVMPVPDARELAALSSVVDSNDGFRGRGHDALMSYLSTKISHVIYVVKENRTYDQVLGDLPHGNGDPHLTLFPRNITPNYHALASEFVQLDNFYTSGESSGVGWNWSVAGHTTDYIEKSQSVMYGNAGFNGLTYDYQGTIRNLNLALPQTIGSNPGPFTVRATGLLDPTGQSSILPGTKDPSGTVGDGDLSPSAVGGDIWDEALRKGRTVRNYGMHDDESYYNGNPPPLGIPIVRHPFENNAPQGPPQIPAIVPYTDIYFRSFDQAAPDVYRLEEWEREFGNYVTNSNLPNLELVYFNHDHFGSFSQAVEGLTNPTLQMADDDYSLGRLVDDVSHSPYWSSTAIVVIEDDSQSGPDHVDGHRSPILVISPYTKHGALVHTAYTTVNAVRTVSDLLGVGHLGMTDANARPIADAFTRHANGATYRVRVPGVLCKAPVAPDLLGAACNDKNALRTPAVALLHDAGWWSQQTQGFNFNKPDAVDADKFNRILWQGLQGDNVAYPGSNNAGDQD